MLERDRDAAVQMRPARRAQLVVDGWVEQTSQRGRALKWSEGVRRCPCGVIAYSGSARAGGTTLARETGAVQETALGIRGPSTVSYTHLTLPTNREV